MADHQLGDRPPYVGALTPAGLTTLPNNQYYIDPQLGYFSDIYDHRKTLGRVRRRRGADR